MTIESELELPELKPGGDGSADVVIRIDQDAKAQPDRFQVEGVASFDVPDGRTIILSPAPEANPVHIRLYLLGTAMGMLLHRRGDLPLHANGVMIGDRAWLFMGASGAGKSTLAAWLIGKGYALLSDDICVVRKGPDGRFFAAPGIPRLRLWDDAARREGHRPETLAPVYPGDPSYRKFNVPIPAQFSQVSVPVEAICLLENGERQSVVLLDGASSVEALFAHTYRGEFVGSYGDPVLHWQQCVELARQVPLFAFCRPKRLQMMDTHNRTAIEQIQEYLGLAASRLN